MAAIETDLDIIEEQTVIEPIIIEPCIELPKIKVKRDKTPAQAEVWAKVVVTRNIRNKQAKEDKKARNQPKWKRDQDILYSKIQDLELRLSSVTIQPEREPEPEPEPEYIQEAIKEPPKRRYFTPRDKLLLFEHLL
jgi:hypothetical protein